MGRTKSIDYEVSETAIAQYAKALGHPARIAILKILLEKQTCICGDLVDEIGLSQSTISQHLKELKQSGVIKGSIDGPRTCYCINEVTWREIQNSFAGLFDSYVPANDCSTDAEGASCC